MADSKVLFSAGNKGYIAPKEALYIDDFTIKSSIFSPLMVDVVIQVQNRNLCLVPYSSVYGFGVLDDEGLNDSKSSAGKATQAHSGGAYSAKVYPFCLFSNKENSFVPFTLLRAEKIDKEHLELHFMEKRAAALALTHKFDVVTPEKNSLIEGASKGLLSVPEILENLSVVAEDEKKDNKKDNMIDSLKNNIVCFSSAGINRDSEKGPINPKQQTEHCAFLSRFVAPDAQSRLFSIYSLARKFGYGLCYRPHSRQYYAVDLLSNTAPGFQNGKVIENLYSDVYTFDDEDDKYYFTEYGLTCKFTDGKLGEKFKNTSGDKTLKTLNPDFSQFFIERIVKTATNFQFYTYSTATGSGNYLYLSTFVPLSYSSSPKGKGFDIMNFSKNTETDVNKAGKNVNVRDKQFNSYVEFPQNQRYTHQDGCLDFRYEDQINLCNVLSLEEKSNKASKKASNKITTVNERLNYARYKLCHMKANCKEYDFKHSTSAAQLSCRFNLVYELLTRLGYHTNLFAKLSDLTKPKVTKRQRATPSGATHSLYEDKLSDDAESASPDIKKLTSLSEDFYQNDPYDITCHIFGQLVMRIKSIPQANSGTEGSATQGSAGSQYEVLSKVYFYSDLYDYNLGATPTMTFQLEKSKIDNAPEPKKPDDKDKDKPQKPEKPVKEIPTMSNFRKTSTNNFEFDFLGKHYSYSWNITEILGNYIAKHIYLNGGSSSSAGVGMVRHHPSELLPSNWDDPILVVRTYLAYRDFNDFNKDMKDIDDWIYIQNKAHKYLKDPSRERTYNEGERSKTNPLYRDYAWALEWKEYAASALERLSKTLAGQHGGFIKDKGRWRVMNLDEKHKMGKNLWGTSMERAEDVPDYRVVNELNDLYKQDHVAWIGKQGVEKAKSQMMKSGKWYKEIEKSEKIKNKKWWK